MKDLQEGKTPAPQHTYVISQYFLYYKIKYNNLLLIYFTVSAQNATQLSKALAVVASCDEHTNLSQVMSKLAQVEENLQQITEEQGDSDFFTFSELLKDYLGQLSAVKVRYYLYIHFVEKQLLRKIVKKDYCIFLFAFMFCYEGVIWDSMLSMFLQSVISYSLTRIFCQAG